MYKNRAPKPSPGEAGRKAVEEVVGAITNRPAGSGDKNKNKNFCKTPLQVKIPVL